MKKWGHEGKLTIDNGQIMTCHLHAA